MGRQGILFEAQSQPHRPLGVEVHKLVVDSLPPWASGEGGVEGTAY